MGSTRKAFSPFKYFVGLTKSKATRRAKEIRRGKALSHKNPAAYKPFATNKGVKTKQSSYTAKWKRQFPKALSLKAKAKATGVPLTYIKASYNRGLAAWRTGHRPGATQQQWGYARVHSFLMCGKTYHTTDSDLAKKAKAASKSAKAWFSSKCQS
jgi:hypothetical protein